MNVTTRFSRSDRLPDAAAFRRVFEDARRSRDRYFTVLWRDNGRPGPRLGLAIARKHCRLATGRNRIKRTVRESFRMHKHSLNGIDVVVLSRPDTAGATSAELRDSLDRHWRRCGGSPEREAHRG